MNESDKISRQMSEMANQLKEMAEKLDESRKIDTFKYRPKTPKILEQFIPFRNLNGLPSGSDNID